MAMFSTYIAWSLLNADVPYFLAFAITLVISFVGAVAIERIIIRPVEKAPELTIVIVTLGLFLFFNSVATWTYTGVPKSFPQPPGVPSDPWNVGGVYIAPLDVTIIVVLLGIMVLLFAFFRYTTLGLAMRAVAEQPVSSRLVGINVGWMLALGWGMAATIGATAGMLIAPVVILEPNFMLGILIFAFAAATLGGFDSPIGAVVGGFILGLIDSLGGRYIDFIGGDLRLVLALVVIVAVLLIKPSGLFGRPAVARV
jgi:branched-chain amino acid transport system permease protein